MAWGSYLAHSHRGCCSCTRHDILNIGQGAPVCVVSVPEHACMHSNTACLRPKAGTLQAHSNMRTMTSRCVQRRRQDMGNTAAGPWATKGGPNKFDPIYMKALAWCAPGWARSAMVAATAPSGSPARPCRSGGTRRILTRACARAARYFHDRVGHVGSSGD